MSDSLSNFTPTTANTTASVTLDLLENLIPALLKVFLVVLVGYIFGRTGLYPKDAARNIAKLCGDLLLPVYVFNAMASISVTPEAWDFFYAVLISKSCVFFMILFLGLAVDRARGRVGRAAISAVFCTQSNDFAMGIPIFQVIYTTTNPGYRFFFYIVAPISFMILNPIAFVLMEFSRRRATGGGFKCNIIGSVFKQVLTSPLVVMTFAGVLLRLLLWQPASDLEWYSGYIEPVFDVISQAFTGCALFSLGLLIVGKFVLLKRNSPVKPIMFILVKSLVLPIILKFVIDLLAPGNTSLSTAGFLYGIFPTAPGVFTYCLHYSMSADMVALSMVLGTIASAPLMLGMGSMVAIATDPDFDINTFGAAVPYFKMIPAILSICGCLFFVSRSCFVFKKLHRDMKIFRTLLLTAGCMLIVCYISLFPCQIMLGEYAANVSSEELYTPGAKFLFIVNYFTIVFFRCLVSAMAIISCLMVRFYLLNGCAPTERYQSIMLYGVHIVIFFVCLICCVSLYAVTELNEDSCVVPFSVTASTITAVVQVFLVVINVFCLVWFNRLRHQLHVQHDQHLQGDDTSSVSSHGTAVDTRRAGASHPQAVSMITFTSDGQGPDNGDIRVTTADQEYANQQEMQLQDAPTFSRTGDIVLGLDESPTHQEPDAVVDFSAELDDGLGDFGPVLAEDGFDIESIDASIANGFEEGDIMDDGKADEEEIQYHKSHPASRYLADRGYNRRFGIIVYETCVGLLAFVALILNVMDTEYTDSDIIIFAVTFILNLLTYSSGIVITVALGFQMCYKRKRAVNTDKPQNLRLDF